MSMSTRPPTASQVRRREPRSEGGKAFLTALGLLAVMWVVQAVNANLGEVLDQDYGILPRTAHGLIGIAAAPWLHASWQHIEGNSLPFVVLATLAAWRGLGRFALASLIIIVVAGLGTWLISPAGVVTIGASGWILGLFTYTIARGFFQHRLADVITALIAGAVYWGIIFDVLPQGGGISWQDHLSGAIGGLIAASVLCRRRAAASPVKPPRPRGPAGGSGGL
jgi:membrane associated rhomboid family serine protease